jgi:hypothetical protein
MSDLRVTFHRIPLTKHETPDRHRWQQQLQLFMSVTPDQTTTNVRRIQAYDTPVHHVITTMLNMPLGHSSAVRTPKQP